MKEITLQQFVDMINSLIESKKYKELLELLPDIEYLKEVVSKAESEIKEYIKYEQLNEFNVWDYQVKYTTYFKYKPVDIKLLQEKYPIEKYPEVYNISLSAKAKKIIQDPELVEKVPVETVRIQKIKKEEIDI